MSETNYIIEGKYKNEPVSTDMNNYAFVGKANFSGNPTESYSYIDKINVKSLEKINEESSTYKENISRWFGSAAGCGASDVKDYIIRIEWHNGEQSLAKVRESIYTQILATTMVDVERNRRSDEKTKREEQQRKQDARIYKKIKREQNIKANLCNEESIKSLKKLQKKLQTSAIIWLCAIVPLLILLSSIIGIISTVIYIGVFILLGIIPSIILVIISATITILSFTTLQKDLKKGVLGNMVSLAVNIIIAIISCISFAPTSLLTAIFFIILNAKYSKTISSKIDVVNQSIDQKTSPTR